jgi:hypothetical protein
MSRTASTREPEPLSERQDRLSRPRVKCERLPRPRTPSIDKCSPAPSNARRGFSGARHRSSGFAAGTRLPTLFRRSRCSRRDRLDPSTNPRALHPRPRGAARRLSTSATDIDPRARPDANRSNPAHRPGSRPPAQLLPRVATLVPANERSFRALAAGRGQPRIHGPGTEARVLFCPTSGLDLSYRNRSRQELRPNPIDPDTSCRKLVTSQAGEPAPPDLDVSEEIHVFRACPTTAANAAFASQGRFGCRSTKNRHIPLNPRCLPLPDVPRPGPSPPIPQSVPSLWSERAGAFSIFVRPVP